MFRKIYDVEVNRKGVVRRNGKELKQRMNGNHLAVRVVIDGKATERHVKDLVWLAFEREKIEFAPVGPFHVSRCGEYVMRGDKRLTPCVNADGYKRFCIRIDGKNTHYQVHRLVCEAYHGEPQEGQVCRHLNGNCLDNRAENLCWGTHSENSADAVKHGTTKTRRIRCVEDGREFESCSHAARRMGLDVGNVSRSALKGWAAGGRHFEWLDPPCQNYAEPVWCSDTTVFESTAAAARAVGGTKQNVHKAADPKYPGYKTYKGYTWVRMSDYWNRIIANIPALDCDFALAMSEPEPMRRVLASLPR